MIYCGINVHLLKIQENILYNFFMGCDCVKKGEACCFRIAKLRNSEVGRLMPVVSIPYASTWPAGFAASNHFTSPSDVWHHGSGSHQQDATSSHKTPWARQGCQVNHQWMPGALPSRLWYRSHCAGLKIQTYIIQNDKLGKFNC